MIAYTISKLAEDAGVSTHIVRDYQMRGILKPSNCMDCGYGIYDEFALERLRFVRAGKEAGVSLDSLVRLCKAIDQSDRSTQSKMQNTIETILESKRLQLELFKHSLKTING